MSQTPSPRDSTSGLSYTPLYQSTRRRTFSTPKPYPNGTPTYPTPLDFPPGSQTDPFPLTPPSQPPLQLGGYRGREVGRRGPRRYRRTVARSPSRGSTSHCTQPFVVYHSRLGGRAGCLGPLRLGDSGRDHSHLRGWGRVRVIIHILGVRRGWSSVGRVSVIQVDLPTGSCTNTRGGEARLRVSTSDRGPCRDGDKDRGVGTETRVW